MKTLIWNGSPRKNGDTMFLLRELIRQLHGDIKIIDTYSCNIRPCIDCRYCCRQIGCSQKDGMQEIYSYIIECDHVVVASPIYFSELTGPLLSAASRLQMFYAAQKFLHHNLIAKPKQGAVILCGGGDGSAQTAEMTAETLLREMGAAPAAAITSLRTDTLPAKDDAAAREKIRKLAQKWNESDTPRR